MVSLLDRRRVVLACGGLLVPGQAIGQESGLTLLREPIGDSGWVVCADGTRVELRADSRLCAAIRFTHLGSQVPAEAAGYGVGSPAHDFAARFALFFSAHGTPQADLAGLAGISFVTPLTLPDIEVGPTPEHMALLAVKASGQTFTSVAFTTRQADGWLAPIMFDVRAALNAMEYADSADVEFAIMSRDGEAIFTLSFELDTTQLAQAKRRFLAEYVARAELYSAGERSTEATMR